jgi:KipI family sensor histidine kinase inhibitor
VPDWVPLGDRAIRFPRPAASARALVREIKAWPGVVDVVIAHEDVAAYFAGPPHVEAAWIAKLADLHELVEAPREHTIAARYTGEDLDAIAAATGLSREDVIAIHTGATYTVETIGFAPGFAYLSGLDPRLHVPRRATPRSRVPARSLAIAAQYTAVYPFDSPGGWHLIGSVETEMFGIHGALLQLGDRVRFTASRQ